MHPNTNNFSGKGATIEVLDNVSPDESTCPSLVNIRAGGPILQQSNRAFGSSPNGWSRSNRSGGVNASVSGSACR
jgi:hypothetical protein